MALRIGHDISAHELADRRSLTRAGYGVMVFAILGVLFKLLPPPQAAVIGAILVLVVACKAVMSILEAKIDMRILHGAKTLRGAVREEQVEDILGQLTGEHVVIDAVRGPFGKIDHVLLSKEHGIFLIEAKEHYGRVAAVDGRLLVNGRLPEKDFVAGTLRSTAWLVEELQKAAGVPVRVNPLVVFTNAFVVTSRAIKGVTVTNKKFLMPGIQRVGKPLAPEVWDAREKMAALLGR
jgi:hypothetical protein